jgi:hypothetical protein
MAYNPMTAAEIRSTVRSIVDLDVDDLPDNILDLYIRDGYYRILDVEKRWPWLETTFTLTTRVNTRAYDVSAITDEPISQVVSIVDPTGVGARLSMIGYDAGEEVYIGSYDTAGDPLFYAVWAGQIHLYPKPNTARQLICRGYREPIDWQTENGDVDAAPSLHFPLVYYAVSRVYQQLEDAALASVYKQSFDEGVALATKNIQTPTSHTPLVLSGGKTNGRPTFKGWMQNMGRNLGQQ